MAILPSATQGGLTRGAENVMRILLERRRREQEDRRIDIQDRDQALRSLASIVHFLPEDTPVSEIPYVQDLIGRAIPEFAGADMRNLIPNKTSLQELLDLKAKSLVEEEGGINDPDLDRILSLRLGLGATTEREREAAGEAAIAGAEAETVGAEAQKSRYEILLDSFQQLQRDPELMTNIARTSFGQDPIFSVDLPGGETISFDSNKAADVWVAMQRLTLDSALESAKLGAAKRGQDIESAKLAQEEREASRDALFGIAEDLGVGLSKENADKMIDAYEKSVTGDYEGEASPWNQLWDSYQEVGDRESLQLMSSMIQSVRTGVQNVPNQLSATPEGRSLLLGISLQSALSEVLDKTVVPDQVAEILNSLEEAGINVGIESTKSGIGGLSGNRVFTLKGAPPSRTDSSSVQTETDLQAKLEELFSDDPSTAADIQITIEELSAGTSEADLRAMFGDEVVDRALEIMGG